MAPSILEDDNGWKTTLDGRQPWMEDNPLWNMTLDGRQPLLEDHLKVPKQMQKTRDESVQSRWRNAQKLVKNSKIKYEFGQFLTVFWTFSQSGLIVRMYSLLHLFRQLETQV